jgi:hypothetical protein
MALLEVSLAQPKLNLLLLVQQPLLDFDRIAVHDEALGQRL